MKAVLLGAIGSAASVGLLYSSWIQDWAPIPLMVMAYWQSGCFFEKPNLKLQRVFEGWDRGLFAFVESIGPARRIAGAIAAITETAYLLCYPVVPLGVIALHLAGKADRIGMYWQVVLLSAYFCYALLPFVQLLPPRSVEPREAVAVKESAVRRFNLWITRHLSHNANTFPSGHVAASAAIALVLLQYAPAVGILFSIIALGISLGCIAGRYHYSVDVIAALILAVTAFVICIY